MIEAPVSDVWAVLADLENAKRWNKSWSRIEITSAQRHGLGTTFRTHLENGDTFDFEVVDWENYRRLAIAPVRDSGERYALMLEQHIFTLRDLAEGGTRIELKAIASAHGIRGRIAGMFFWAGHQEAGLNEALNSIQRLVEENEPDLETADLEQQE
jgi:hypothetical protein